MVQYQCVQLVPVERAARLFVSSAKQLQIQCQSRIHQSGILPREHYSQKCTSRASAARRTGQLEANPQPDHRAVARNHIYSHCRLRGQTL